MESYKEWIKIEALIACKRNLIEALIARKKNLIEVKEEALNENYEFLNPKIWTLYQGILCNILSMFHFY